MSSKFLPLPANTVERLKELPQRVATLEGLIALWLFGSLARDAWTPISDVDLAYLSCEEWQGEALDRFEARLYSTIASTLHTDDIDLVHLRFAPVYLAWRVLTEGRLLWCADKSAVATVAEAVYRRAPDIHWLRHTGNVDFLKGRGMSDPAIDRDRVIEFLRLISADVQDLREKAKTSKEEYLRSRDMQAIVERRLQTAIESCLNIGNHLIARLGLRPPQDYGDVFRILRDAYILPSECAEAMVDMARFRNLLVHLYWQLDYERIYDSLQGRFASLEAFASRIEQWLRDQGSV
jgi:uncharacterized protein YutE (UPF0331/DUF86 family)/predicted nucleotidyltransferase